MDEHPSARAPTLALPHGSSGSALDARDNDESALRQRMTLIVVSVLTLFLLHEALGGGGAIFTSQGASGPITGAQHYKAMWSRPAAHSPTASSASGGGFQDEKQIVVLLTAGRDSEACARAVIAARDLAYRSDRLHFRIFEEIAVTQDVSCLRLFCDARPRDCRELLRAKQLRVVRRDVSGEMGVSVAKHIGESLIDKKRFAKQFYLSVDEGIAFSKHWDIELLKQWFSIGNDRAVLSVAPPAIELKGWVDDELFVQCSARIHSKDEDSVVAFNPPEPRPKTALDERFLSPLLQTQYSERFHFGMVATLLAVRSDPHLSHLAIGHEYMRATRFWTRGFDFYAPTKAILFHRYEWPLQEHEIGYSTRETQRASRRVRRLLGLRVSFTGEPLPERVAYSAGPNRTVAAWRAFSGIDPSASFNESTNNQFIVCDRELHYLHYAD